MKLGGATALAALFPSIIPSRVLGADAPSKRINVGFVGVGLMGGFNLDSVLGLSDAGVYVRAVCDVDRERALAAQRKVEAKQQETGCLVTGDFREITRHPDLDAVVVSTPDHWHALVGIDAIRHGKDVYIEKPLTLTIAEGQALVAAMKKHGRIGQTGTHQRSGGYFHRTVELVRNGRLGKISGIDITIPGNNRFCPGTWREEPVPAGFDYEMWLGPAPWAPFTAQRTHYQFRFILDYALGQTTNWGSHYVDIAQWALGMDDSGPVSVEGYGDFPSSGLFTVPSQVYFACRYANGVEMRVRSRDEQRGDGVIRFHGERGWLEVSRRGVIAENRALLKEKIGPEEIQIPRSRHHWRNFFECIRTRQNPIADLSIGHRTTTICNLGMIAMQRRRLLEWDPAKETFVNDPLANRMRGRAMRGPWSLL